MSMGIVYQTCRHGDGKGNGGDPQNDNGSTTEKMLDKSDKVSTSLDVVSFSSYISGAPKLGIVAGHLGTGVAALSLGYEGYNVYTGKASATRFAYHLSGFAAALSVDITIGTEIGGPYGSAAGAGVGLTFGAAELYYDNVVVPYIEKPFNRSFNSFMRSYFNIPSF